MEDANQIDLTRSLSSAYGITGPVIDFICTGVDGNRTFKVADSSGTHILRIYGEQGRQHTDWIRYELELLAHLAANGISVAGPVAARDGSLFHVVDNNPIAFFEFADGSVEWPTSPERSGILGASFARMHRAADLFRTTADHRLFNTDRLLNAPLKLIRDYLDDTEADDRATWATLVDTASQAAEMLQAIPDTGGSIGPIHGDLHQGNCHFHGDNLQFFDFSNAGAGWRVYDLSGFLWPLRDDTILDPSIRAACDAFLDGYNDIRPLSREEQRAIAASVKARDFWETGGWLEYGHNIDRQAVRHHLVRLAERFRRHPILE